MVDEGFVTDLIMLSQNGPLTNPETRAMLREKIAEVESAMLTIPQVEVPIVNHFSKDVYAREMFVPRGTFLVGKIHKYQNLNIISKGEVSFISIDGAVRVKAPHTFVGSPGAKRVIYAHEDTVWTTIHGTDETNVSRIEDEFIATDYEDFYLHTDRTFEDVCMVLGASENQIKQISENEADQIPFPSPCNVKVHKSSIHGMGLFAKIAFYRDELIAPARIGGKRTPAGRFTNHASFQNAKMVLNDKGDVDLVAIAFIEPGDEIVTDYFYNYINTRG